jgi:hypothetical protein
MNSVQKTLYSERNIKLLKSLVANRIFASIGVDVNERKDFVRILQQVAQAVMGQEIEKVKHLELSQAVLKVNTIIIVEAVNFLISQIDADMSIPDVSQGPPWDPREPQRPPDSWDPRESVTPQEPIAQPVPHQKDILYNIDSKNLDYTTPHFTYDGNLEGVGEVELISIFIDNTDYNVSHLKNALTVNQQEIIIQPGNYCMASLHAAIKSQLPPDLVFEANENTGKFTFSGENCKIDFTVKHSMHKILGFQRKIYNESGKTLVEGDTSFFKNTPFVDVSIIFKSNGDTKNNIDSRIPMDVARGCTKFYYPPLKHVIKEMSSFDSVLIVLKDYEGNEFFTQNRDFHVSLRVNINCLF